MRDFQATIDKIFNGIEIRLSAKLLTDGFQIRSQTSTPRDFGSRCTEWRNETSKYALRLIWDGKESWFLVEESTGAPNSWADIVLVPVDKTKVTDVSYSSSVIEDIVNEVH